MLTTQQVATLYSLLTCLYVYAVLSITVTLFTFNDAARTRYVRSNTSIPCPTTQNPCLTFAEYANETDRYFVHDTIFNFSPGTHYLNFSLKLRNINHFSFHGLSVDGVSTINFDTNASIVFENCSYVEVSSVIFDLIGKYTYSLEFKHSVFVHLTNISIFGKKNGRFSAIVSHNSSVNITDSLFAYVEGTIGAVILMSKSTVVLSGNSFVKNMAISGGAIYMTDSIIFLNGTNIFMNNKLNVKGMSGWYDLMWTTVIGSFLSGGAIVSHNSFLIQYVYSILSFVDNTAECSSGGAISGLYSHLWFAGNVLFENNTAYTGGAMNVYHTIVYFDGKISFLRNHAVENGGALHICNSEVSYSGTKQLILPFILFHYNTAVYKGGSMQIANSTLLLTGNANFRSNSAKTGGALNVEANSTLLRFNGNVKFLDNSAKNGGALNILNGIIQFNGSIYFINNSAIIQGGALSISASFVLFNPASQFIVPLYTAAQLMSPIQAYDQSVNTSEHSMPILFFNNSAGTGGAIHSISSVIKFGMYVDAESDHCTILKDSPLDAIESNINNLSMYSVVFIQNNATNGSGGSINSFLSTLHFVGSVLFDKNEAKFGGALNLADSTSWLSGDVLFINNAATKHGGALEMLRSTISFNSSCTAIFHNNKAKTIGGAIRSLNSDNLLSVGIVLFSDNYADMDGGAIHAESTSINFIGHIYFKNNSAATDGGALLTSHSNVTFNFNPLFHGTTLFTLNRALYSGGSIKSIDGLVQFAGIIVFSNNTAGKRGGVMQIVAITMEICCNVFFLHNTAKRGGSIHSMRCSNVSFFGYNTSNSVQFFHNEAAEYGGSIKGRDSMLEFKTNALFRKNTACDGGAIALHGTNQVILYPNQTVSFILNHAKRKGGAIFYEDSLSSIQCSAAFEPKACFISIGSADIVPHHLLVFEDNFAGIAGAVLYGGQLEKCRMYIGRTGNLNNCKASRKPPISALNKFKEISTINDTRKDSNSIITSDAEIVKYCDPDYFSKVSVYKSIFPGQQFTVSVVALGQDNVIVNSTILSKLLSSGENYILNPTKHHINASCSTIAYNLYTPTTNIMVQYKLYHESLCQSLAIGPKIKLQVLPCPLGFDLPGPLQLQACVCSPLLKKFTQQCYINDLSIERSNNNFWVAQSSNDTLIIHGFRCPFDFCKNISINVTLTDPYVQCDFNRTGILCGECNEHYSVALGSLHCIVCNSSYILLIIPFAIIGIILIAGIYLLNLTASTGMLSGLLFYANVIQANYQAFFPRDTVNFFTIFLAWLNLDIGIETCFYDGMDIYVYSWLQFLFPLYLWFLISTIIVISRYTQRIAKSLGQNPVTILATLLLMSYSKILGATIAPSLLDILIVHIW